MDIPLKMMGSFYCNLQNAGFQPFHRVSQELHNDCGFSTALQQKHSSAFARNSQRFLLTMHQLLSNKNDASIITVMSNADTK